MSMSTHSPDSTEAARAQVPAAATRSVRSAKGVLALVTGPVLFLPFDNNAMKLRRKRKRIPRHCVHTNPSNKSVEPTFDQTKSEFTVLFFGASYCPNSWRFAPLLADFVQNANSIAAKQDQYDDESDQHGGSMVAVQCLFVPDSSSGDEVERFCRGTGFLVLPHDHANIPGLRTLLSISVVPTAVVVRNDTGRVVTDWGRTAIEFNPDGAIESWRRGDSGAPLYAKVCTVS